MTKRTQEVFESKGTGYFCRSFVSERHSCGVGFNSELRAGRSGDGCDAEDKTMKRRGRNILELGYSIKAGLKCTRDVIQ
jgi:hypothetical protein